MPTITAVGHGKNGLLLIDRLSRRYGVPVNNLPQSWYQLSPRREVKFSLNDELAFIDLQLEIAREFVFSSGGVRLYQEDNARYYRRSIGPLEIISAPRGSLPPRSWEILALAQEAHDRRGRN